MDISAELKKEAVRLNLCEEWTEAWKNPSLEEMADMYIRGLDFCIENNYPSNDFIKAHFGKVAEDKGVFTDTEVNLLNPEIAILNGNCTGTIELTGYASRDIHVRHDSKVKIIVRDYATAFVRVYDNAHAIIDNQTKTKKSFVYHKGGKATITGNVAVRYYKYINGEWVKQ